jgi:transketolase
VRVGFSEGLIEAARRDTRVHVLTGDHGYALFDEFRREFPERFHNVGVAEANMVGIAAGMARNGIRPLIYGLASFVPNRVFEFIKLQISLDRLPVVIVGDGAGLVYSYLGKSHQTLEDLALMGALEQIKTISPASDQEMKKALLWAFLEEGPVYLRMGKSGGVYEGTSQSETPEPHKVFDSTAVDGNSARRAFVSHGAMVSEVLDLIENSKLAKMDLWSCPTIFPIDAKFIEILKEHYSTVFVVEEHLLRGGLASELLILLRASEVTVIPVCAMPNHQSDVGSYEWNLTKHELSSTAILKALETNP